QVNPEIIQAREPPAQKRDRWAEAERGCRRQHTKRGGITHGDADR
ncbi:unnamed protein product, partial [Laminaria digitata]